MNVIKIVISSVLILGIGSTVWFLSKLSGFSRDSSEKNKTGKEKGPENKVLEKSRKINTKVTTMVERSLSHLNINKIMITAALTFIAAVSALIICKSSPRTLGKLNEQDANNVFESSSSHDYVIYGNQKSATGFEFFEYLKKFLETITSESIKAAISLFEQKTNYLARKYLADEIYTVIFETGDPSVLYDAVHCSSLEELHEENRIKVEDKKTMSFIYKILNIEKYSFKTNYGSRIKKIVESDFFRSHSGRITNPDELYLIYKDRDGTEKLSSLAAHLYLEIVSNYLEYDTPPNQVSNPSQRCRGIKETTSYISSSGN